MALPRRFSFSAFPAALIAAAVGASVAGGIAAWITRGEPPESAADVSAASTSGVLEGDPRISYPAALTGLPVSPSHLAAKEDGTLWFLLFEDGGAGTPALYGYDRAHDTRQRFVLPDSYGSMLFSGITVAPNGHIVAAYGYVVVDFDPAVGVQKEIELPDPSANFFELEPPEGSWITDIAIDEPGNVLLGRSRTSSVTVVDLRVGSVEEIPLPKSFGSVKKIATTGKGVYVSNVYGDPGIGRQAGLLTLDGDFTPLSLSVNAFATDPQGSVCALSPDDGDLYLLSGASPAKVNSAGALLNGAGDRLAWDVRSSALWIAGEAAGNLARLRPASDAMDTYALPVYKHPAIGCPPDLPCQPRDAPTLVGGLAVAPDGTFYFSDMAAGRIGVITSGQ